MYNINSYRDLIVWQKSIELTRQIYLITAKFPKNEIFGLTMQMRRCAVSIPSNIAEGSGRGTRKDYTYFLRISLGLCNELQTQIEISKNVLNIDNDKLIIAENILTENKNA